LPTLAAGEAATSDAGVLAATRKTILFVTHNYVGRGDFGGVEIYLDRLRAKISDEFNILFYVRGGPGEQYESLLLSHDYTLLKRYKFPDAFGIGMLSSPEREKAFQALLIENQVDFVHFHHFIGHAPSLVYIAKSLGVPTAITLHDYWAVCNEYQLISFKGGFCGAPEVSLSQCDLCLWKRHQIIPGSQAARREFWNGVLAAADLLIFSTAGVRDLVSTTYPAVRQHQGVRLLPVPIHDDELPARFVTGLNDKKEPDFPVLKVAILGNVTLGKGGDLFAPTVSALVNAPIEFHVFGRLDPAYAYLDNKQLFPNLVVHGPYLADQLPADLLHCDVSVHVSIWPETYCLTLSEAWQNGIVPIVADIGALGERVKDRVNGLKIRAGEEGELVNAVRLLAEDRNLLMKLRSNISNDLYETLTPHVTSLVDEYRRHLRNLPHGAAGGTPVRASGIAELGIVLQSPSWFQHGAAPRISVSEEAGARSPLQSLTRALVPARIRRAVKRSKLRNVYAFYAHHGFKQTATLLAKRTKRILWKR
jgi:glycosyltransferase involved in cell wall biosynthesis